MQQLAGLKEIFMLTCID